MWLTCHPRAQEADGEDGDGTLLAAQSAAAAVIKRARREEALVEKVMTSSTWMSTISERCGYYSRRPQQISSADL